MVEGDAIPGLPDGVVPVGGDTPVINANGVIVTDALLTGPGVDASNNRAIVWAEADTLGVVARHGDPVPGTAGDVFFDDFTSVVVNSRNEVAFAATLTGPGVTPATFYAIFVGTVGLGTAGSLQQVVRYGDAIELEPGVSRTVTGLEIRVSYGERNTGNEDGRPSYLSETGELAFVAEFSGGSSAVLTWPGGPCVSHTNQPPSITSTPPTSGSQGVLYTYDVDATDPDGDTLTYSLDVRPIGMFIDPASGLIQWTPLAGQDGAIAVTVRATDPDGLFDTQSFEVVIPVPNRPPVIVSVPPLDATVGATYVYDVDATDPDGDTLTYSLVIRPLGTTINPATGLLQWTPTATGSYPFRVRVTDPDGQSVQQSFTVTVSVGNQAPTITTSPPLAGTENAPYSYDVDATDSDGDPLTYSLDAAPAGMTIDAVTGVIQWTPGSTQLGSNAVTVRAADPGGLFDTQSYAIVVAAANRAPTITTSPPVAGSENAPYSYDVDATDPDGDALTYSLDAAPAGMTIDAVTGVIQWTPGSTQLGSNAVIVRVADPGGLFDTQSYAVVVAAANRAPTADPGGPYDGTVGAAVTFDGSESMDPDGTIVAYDWYFGDGSMGSGPTPSHAYLVPEPIC